jgi:hypothetical protein
MQGWGRLEYDALSIGYPGPVKRGKPAREPHNLGGGWIRFDYEKAFGAPVTVVNDAAMQAPGAYAGGQMLFLGLGTGLGSALVAEGILMPRPRPAGTDEVDAPRAQSRRAVEGRPAGRRCGPRRRADEETEDAASVSDFGNKWPSRVWAGQRVQRTDRWG